jgi:hypothetical protein
MNLLMVGQGLVRALLRHAHAASGSGLARGNLHTTAIVLGSLLLSGCSGDTGPALGPPADPSGEEVVAGTPSQPTGDGAGPQGDPQPAVKPSEDNTAAAVPEPPSPLEGWPKPTVALFITGQQMGYLEPCGCTGLENQKGGLARRHTLLRELATEKGWNVVPVDVGSQIRRYGRQQEIKFQRTADALRTLGYKAVVLGEGDLRLPAGELLTGTNPPDDQPSIFTSANVAVLGRDLQPSFQVVEAAGKKIGIVGVLADSLERKLQGDDVVHEPSLDALKRSAAELTAANCDYQVLLVHGTVEESKELAAAVPQFDLVVTSGGGGLPSTELEALGQNGVQPATKLLKVSHKAMHVGIVGLFDDPTTPIRYAAVPLDAKLADSPEMLQLLADYQEQLKADGLGGLGLTPQPHPSGRNFIGSETCGECHTKAYEIWSKTPHAHATDSLVRPPNTRGDIARHYDPECLSCHVTGWAPQRYSPYESGYLSLEATPKLQHNGCENCHGPGREHAEAESGDDEALQKTLREGMKLPIAGGIAENKCRECHDEDNSPDFSHKGFAEYWKEVEHRGKD